MNGKQNDKQEIGFDDEVPGYFNHTGNQKQALAANKNL